MTEATGENELGYPIKIFLNFDPLLMISSFLSSHTFVMGFLFALVLVAVTILLGRVFCGWICPLGTIHNMVGSAAGSKRGGVISSRWFRFKYYLLFFILASSLATAQLAGYADPLSLLVRSLALSIWPAFEYVIRAIFDGFYYLDIPFVTGASEAIYDLLRNTILSFRPVFFLQGSLIGLFFIGILALNLIERRFWCRYICPLGALLGLLSRRPLIGRDISEGCTACGTCRSVCPGGAIRDKKGEAVPSECMVCLECDDICPAGAVRFRWKYKSPAVPLDIKKRTALAAFAGGIAVVPFLRITPAAGGVKTDTRLIRPPGALPEQGFLSACIRCGECMKICITAGLQPTFLQAGLEGIWTPYLVPQIGHCELRCTLCGQVCPTGAIRELTIEEKTETKIGMAVIDKGRCLPFSFGMECLVCEEVCPTSPKAIWLEEAKVIRRNGKTEVLKQPRIDLEKCTGCGICEASCPVAAKPAVYVISTGETRSEDNRVLL